MTETAPTLQLPVMTGILEEKSDEMIALHLLGSNYRLHLRITQPISAEPGARVKGTIHAQARRVDAIPAGGKFVEPVFGRPRQIQGTIVGGDLQANALHVKAGPAVVIAKLMTSQKAGDFSLGQMVNFSVERGATFQPAQA